MTAALREITRRADFIITCGELDGIDGATEKPHVEHLHGLIYLDIQIGNDSISGWVRPEVARRIKAAFGAYVTIEVVTAAALADAVVDAIVKRIGRTA